MLHAPKDNHMGVMRPFTPAVEGEDDGPVAVGVPLPPPVLAEFPVAVGEAEFPVALEQATLDEILKLFDNVKSAH